VTATVSLQQAAAHWWSLCGCLLLYPDSIHRAGWCRCQTSGRGLLRAWDCTGWCVRESFLRRRVLSQVSGFMPRESLVLQLRESVMSTVVVVGGVLPGRLSRQPGVCW